MDPVLEYGNMFGNTMFNQINIGPIIILILGLLLFFIIYYFKKQYNKFNFIITFYIFLLAFFLNCYINSNGIISIYNIIFILWIFNITFYIILFY